MTRDKWLGHQPLTRSPRQLEPGSEMAREDTPHRRESLYRGFDSGRGPEHDADWGDERFRGRRRTLPGYSGRSGRSSWRELDSWEEQGTPFAGQEPYEREFRTYQGTYQGPYERQYQRAYQRGDYPREYRRRFRRGRERIPRAWSAYDEDFRPIPGGYRRYGGYGGRGGHGGFRGYGAYGAYGGYGGYGGYGRYGGYRASGSGGGYGRPGRYGERGRRESTTFARRRWPRREYGW